MSEKYFNWLDERVGFRSIWQAIFLRKIPKVNWLFTLGSATLFTAFIQIFTGRAFHAYILCPETAQYPCEQI